MAGSFGDTVGSLLETYTRCLALLKRSRRPPEDEAAADEAELRRAIRSDRSEVQRVYSSRLSKNGNKLTKGDAAARSMLRRVVKRLTTAMRSVIGLAQTGQHSHLDYESLMSLSNASRVDAVRTIKDLSSRVSVASSHRSSGSHGRDDTARRRSAASAEDHHKDDGGRRRHRRSHHDGAASPVPARDEKRASQWTMSSGSTKLGEVRNSSSRTSRPSSHRRRSSGGGSSTSSAVSSQVVMRPTYPLRPFGGEFEARQKKGFWDFLRRS